MIDGAVRRSSLIEALNSNLSSDFLAALATFKEESNKTSRANSDYESDVSEVVANKAFLKKDLKNKSDSESDYYVNPKSKDDDDNDNSIATSLQGSQKSKKLVNNNKFANCNTPWAQKKLVRVLNEGFYSKTTMGNQ